MAAPQPTHVPQRSRGFSVKSDHSHRTSTSGHKSQLSESSEEKARRNLHTKADPLVAMTELQPMAVALEKSNLASLRETQHRDQFGELITDPDWSNPTRPRFERPLDTIRSFEAAINGTYGTQRRGSYARTDDAASQMGDFSRRTSYYGSNNRGHENQYGRNGQSRPGSVIDYASSSQALENPYPYNQNGQQRRPRYQSRQSTDQGVYGNGNQYGAPQYHQRSYDNVTAMSGSASGNTDYGQSTDPSSLNSSVDQLQQRQDGAEYGYQSQVNGRPSAPAASSTYVPSQGGMNVVKKPTNLNDKRKSWFKRRFSKD
ncbi:uncharacterized protein N7484_007181 [Penicillium longicatenatum]|uniref:uncharacterized protein n=1 Tax=Penicillium longicatenatum TaxID=1561947 RepID=UPI0025492CFA|nr:uncharacterized protein N7484_007181 [Penicillium longicatenatum]KAJ5639319.1 hypothetical protein N7484_007181 [Penicillium longicatenatum]